MKRAALNSKSKRVPSASSSQTIPKRRKLPTATTEYGHGEFATENVGFTCMQSGLKSSVVVTGDLGFRPTTRKRKGKEIATQPGLINAAARRHVGIRIGAANLRESQSQPLPPTKAQNNRAAANKAAAEKRLAARTHATNSTQLGVRMTRSKSSSQPTKMWKY